jgi:ABC-type amino acid transport substrate-binding protein
VKDLDQALRDLRNLQADQAFVDPSNLAALQASAIDKLKKFEFNLRKKSENDDQQLSLSASDEVPAGFRTAIEEYYRALAKKQQ